LASVTDPAHCHIHAPFNAHELVGPIADTTAKRGTGERRRGQFAALKLLSRLSLQRYSHTVAVAATARRLAQVRALDMKTTSLPRRGCTTSVIPQRCWIPGFTHSMAPDMPKSLAYHRMS
jgi:hypothetical protein